MTSQGPAIWPCCTSWLIPTSEREPWPSDDLARVVDELLRLKIEVKQLDDGIGIVGSEHTEELLATSRQPVRIAIYRLIRSEQKRQQNKDR